MNIHCTYYRIFAFLGLLAVFCAISPAQSSSPDNEIRRLLERQQKAWNQGDIDGFMGGYWKSPDLVFTSGGQIHRGWLVTLDQYKKSYPDRRRMGQLFFSDLEIHLLNAPGTPADEAPAAWILGKWRLQRDTDEPHGIFTLVLRKFPSSKVQVGGEWKIIHDHTSSSPAGVK